MEWMLILFIAHKGQFLFEVKSKLWLVKTEFIAFRFKETLLSEKS